MGGAPDALLRRYGRTPKENLRSALLTMGMQEGAQYLIREYDLPLSEDEYYGVMREVIAELYETVELKPGVREMLARLRAEGARICLCSNTWADQCRTVLRRLGVLDDFEFIVEARVRCTRAARRCSPSAWSGWAEQTLPPAPCARTPFTPPPPPKKPGITSSASQTRPLPPTKHRCAGCVTSSCPHGARWTGPAREPRRRVFCRRRNCLVRFFLAFYFACFLQAKSV